MAFGSLMGDLSTWMSVCFVCERVRERGREREGEGEREGERGGGGGEGGRESMALFHK